MVMKKIKDLNSFADFINKSDEWKLIFNDIIYSNNWEDETGSDFGICNDGKNRLIFDSNMIAVVIPM